MKRTILVTCSAIAIAGCGQQSDMEAAVKSRLKDPGSVQFKTMVIGKEGYFACIEYNAKNSMGGYGNWSIAELSKISGDWEVLSMEAVVDNCTADHLALRESTVRAIKDLGRAVGR